VRFAVFVYDFPHSKTQLGLFNLWMSGLRPELVIAAPRTEVKRPLHVVRTSPDSPALYEPGELCRSFGLEYVVSEHNSTATSDLIDDAGVELGVILGARKLSTSIISKFEIGILNTHPGLMPLNRGLDTMLWAVLNGIPQGVTSHLIDGKLDAGLTIEKRIQDVDPDDSLIDIGAKAMNMQQDMLVEAVRAIENGERGRVSESGGAYHSALTPDEQLLAVERYGVYRADYADLKDRYQANSPQ
jgi:hypothetical protein